mmetsp:Transcript_9896/g.26883  ORF Transcript_9896/g.26883 Transcript_9896/m.26883 type:complete len:253 (-) Transcript_9896:274-1032(-)
MHDHAAHACHICLQARQQRPQLLLTCPPGCLALELRGCCWAGAAAQQALDGKHTFRCAFLKRCCCGRCACIPKSVHVHGVCCCWCGRGSSRLCCPPTTSAAPAAFAAALVSCCGGGTFFLILHATCFAGWLSISCMGSCQCGDGAEGVGAAELHAMGCHRPTAHQQGKREEQCGAAGRPLHHAHVLRLQMKMASAYPAHFHRHRVNGRPSPVLKVPLPAAHNLSMHGALGHRCSSRCQRGGGGGCDVLLRVL